MQSCHVTICMKATCNIEQCIPVVLFIMLYNLDGSNRGGGGGGSNFPYGLLNEIQTMFSQLAKQSSRQ